MNKSEKISIAIGKCFNKSRLLEDDMNTIKDLGASGLLDHGLNENQIRQVMLWCQHECQREWAQSKYRPSDFTPSNDLNNQGLQDVYEKYPKSPYSDLAMRGFRS